MSCESETIDALRESGHKMTPQRMMILTSLRHAPGHLSAAEIFEEVKAAYPYVDISTVYRTLSVLKDMRLISETHMGGGDATFEWVATERHHHLICRKCEHVDRLDHHLRKTRGTSTARLDSGPTWTLRDFSGSARHAGTQSTRLATGRTMLTIILLAALPASPLLRQARSTSSACSAARWHWHPPRHRLGPHRRDHRYRKLDSPGCDDCNEWLAHGPGLMLADESHHPWRGCNRWPSARAQRPPWCSRSVAAAPTRANSADACSITAVRRSGSARSTPGHRTVVAVLGLIAIIASQFLPAWVDPIM
jgi:Fe2+ or Zn2+ uptake regulation protein